MYIMKSFQTRKAACNYKALIDVAHPGSIARVAKNIEVIADIYEEEPKEAQ